MADPARPARGTARILATNDFFGSFFRQPTSYGELPGAAALESTITRLRDEAGGGLWADAGDLAPGGPLAPLTAGSLGFLAAAQLPIDVALPGNHEFDWGVAALRRWAGELPFPVLLSDPGCPVGTGTVVREVAGHSIGFIGYVAEELRGLNIWASDVWESGHPGLAGPPGYAAVLPHLLALAAELRRDCDHVVLLVHDGVEAPAGGDTQDAGRLAALIRSMGDAVDAVIGGHTLKRHIGSLGGRPFVQPWPFGHEVGVLDFGPTGEVHVSGIVAHGDGDWRGTGAGFYNQLQNEIVGSIREPLILGFGGERSLAEAVAAGVRAVTEADVAVVTAGECSCGQPALDGVCSYIPAGPVSEAQIARFLPWPEGPLGDETWVAELSPSQLTALLAVLTEPQLGPPSVARGDRDGGLVAVSSNSRWLAESATGVAWSPSGHGLREGLRSYLRAA
jgi:hypothetical protein